MTRIVDADAFESRRDTDNVTSDYREFRDAEGVPVHTGLAIDDWNALEVGPWDRTGQRGAFVNLYGAEGINDLQVHELAPGGRTAELCHRYDQLVYVADGGGFTAVGTGDDERVFEWERNALFFLPAEVPYRHLNARDEPARLVAETPLPELLTLYKDADYLLESSGRDRSLADGYYDADATIVEADHPDRPGGVLSWVANFVPDVLRFERLEDHQARGAGGQSVLFPFPETSMWAHISQFPVGTYKKAHRHAPGANVGVLSGEGFTLLWEEDWDEKVRIDWSPRTCFTPPARWFHQHFNTGEAPARYFAMHGPKLGTLEEANLFDYRHPANQIEYPEEDPAIRDLYAAELESRGLESRMPAACYEDPDFEFAPG